MSSITYAQAMENVREHDDLYDRHWNECRQISEYEEENRKMKALLLNVESLLGVALFVHWQSEQESRRVREEIQRICGGDSE